MTSLFKEGQTKCVPVPEKKNDFFRRKFWKTGSAVGLVAQKCFHQLSKQCDNGFSTQLYQKRFTSRGEPSLSRVAHLIRKVHLLRKPNGNRYLPKSYRKWCSKFSANFNKHAIYSDIDWFSSDKDPKNGRSVNFYTEYSRVYFFQKCLVVDKHQAQRGGGLCAFRVHISSGPL